MGYIEKMCYLEAQNKRLETDNLALEAEISSLKRRLLECSKELEMERDEHSKDTAECQNVISDLEAKNRVDSLVIKRLDEGMTALRAEKDAEIERLRSELEDVKNGFPIEAIKIADFLIEKSAEQRIGYVQAQIESGNACDSRTIDIMCAHEVSLLEEIAEHLLIYCSHAEV